MPCLEKYLLLSHLDWHLGHQRPVFKAEQTEVVLPACHLPLGTNAVVAQGVRHPAQRLPLRPIVVHRLAAVVWGHAAAGWVPSSNRQWKSAHLAAGEPEKCVAVVFI